MGELIGEYNEVNEALKNRDLGYVVDDFVRYLIGDRKRAILGLKSFMKEFIDIPKENYSDIYDKLFDGISKVITENVPPTSYFYRRKSLTEKIDLLINEPSGLVTETEFAYRYPDERSLSKYKDYRAIQFLRPWEIFRTGDRADIYFGKTMISIVGTNSEGYFAGIKKSHNCTDSEKQAEFKSLEGKIWFFV